MSHRKRRWARVALSAALCGSAMGADDPGVVPPPPPDVTTLPVITIEAIDQPRKVPAPADVALDVPTVPVLAIPTPPPVVAPPTEPVAVPAPEAAPPPPSPPACDAPPFLPPPIPERSASGGFYAGGALLFLTPYVSNNTAYTLITPPVPPGPTAFPLAIGSAQSVPFDWNARQAWQVWAGWIHPSGWGVRTGAFVFNQGSNVQSPIAAQMVAVPGVIPFIPGTAAFGAPTAVLAGAGIGTDRLLFSSDLNIRSVDLELTYQWAGDDFVIRLTGGGRWQSLRQGYHAALQNFGDGITTEAQRLDFVQEFSGAGPTVGLFVRHDLVGGLGAYAGVRGAILAGHLEQRAAYSQDINDPALLAFVGSQQTRTRFDNRADHVLTFGELELGLEYGVMVGRSRLHGRAGLIGQSYGNGGNATASLGTLSLMGGQASVGINY